MLEEIKAFLNKPFVKNFLLAALTFVIGGLCSAMGMWDPEQDPLFFRKIIAIAISFCCYIVLLGIYSTYEVNLNRENWELEHQRKALETAIVALIAICQQSAKRVNLIIHDIVERGAVDARIWNFDIACDLVCEKIYDLLCKLNEKSKDYGVAYVRLLEDNAEGRIKMCAYCNQDSVRPSIYNVPRRISDQFVYHDAKFFQQQDADIEVLYTKDEVRRAFVFPMNQNKDTNFDKYNQYIAVPVVCLTDSGGVQNGKIIGLLEVVCLHDTKLCNSKDELKELASKYLVPYASLLLLLHKLEKVIKVQSLHQKDKQNRGLTV